MYIFHVSVLYLSTFIIRLIYTVGTVNDVVDFALGIIGIVMTRINNWDRGYSKSIFYQQFSVVKYMYYKTTEVKRNFIPLLNRFTCVYSRCIGLFYVSAAWGTGAKSLLLMKVRRQVCERCRALWSTHEKACTCLLLHLSCFNENTAAECVWVCVCAEIRRRDSVGWWGLLPCVY